MFASSQSYGVMLARQMNAVSDSHDSSEESLDFAQALNTALCFLCWINADVRVVETFLRRWPEALLLEGTNQDCAPCIVKQRMKQPCLCPSGVCNKNREDLLDLMSKGFQFYQDQHIKDLVQGRAIATVETPIGDLNSTTVFPQLMSTGRYLRGLAIEESSVHSQLVETHVAKIGLERELERATALSKRMKSRVLSLFACGNEHSKDQAARIARLEFDVEMAHLKFASVRKEHKLLVRAIDQGHRNQYALLKGVFVGCERHECNRSLAMNRVSSILDRKY